MYEEDDDDDAVDTPVEDSDDNGDETVREVERQDFDKNIPTTHEYLGKLDNISGYTLYEDGQIIKLPAVYTNTLAFPGFTLPLVLFYSEENFQSGSNFVLLWRIKEKRMFFEYGIVMEVYERSVDQGQMNIKARGRQRCYILPQEMVMNSYRHMSQVTVKIVEEPVISSPLSCTQLTTLRQRFPYRGDYSKKIEFEKYRKLHLGQFTFPYWVYDLYEVDYYVDKIVQILSKYYTEENIPKDPTLLSYWFGQNFQLMNSERLQILQSNTTLERLRYALKYLNIERQICCALCGAIVSHQKQVFDMSKEGLQSNYVNPGGVVYETVTVRRVCNHVVKGTPCEDFSWFPGYAWNIITCFSCSGHLGWLFTSKKLQPNKFFGLARSCLSIKTIKKGEVDEEVEEAEPEEDRPEDVDGDEERN